MRYRLKASCFFVHESLKRDIQKENDKRKKKSKIIRKNSKIFFNMLLRISSYHFWKLVVNNLYRP